MRRIIGYRLVRPSAPRMLRSVPRNAVTTTRRIVMAAPVPISLMASPSQLKSRLLPIGLEIFQIQRPVEPFGRDRVHRPIGQHFRNDVIEGLLQARLVLVQPDMVWRSHELELLL